MIELLISMKIITIELFIDYLLFERYNIFLCSFLPVRFTLTAHQWYYPQCDITQLVLRVLWLAAWLATLVVMHACTTENGILSPLFYRVLSQQCFFVPGTSDQLQLASIRISFIRVEAAPVCESGAELAAILWWAIIWRFAVTINARQIPDQLNHSATSRAVYYSLTAVYHTSWANSVTPIATFGKVHTRMFSSAKACLLSQWWRWLQQQPK